MTWTDIGVDHLHAAKEMKAAHPRSCVSRSYYAAHVVLAEALLANGYVPTPGRQTPAHNAQARLIGVHLSQFSRNRIRELRELIRRLYARRIDADYKRTVSIDQSIALESLRDAADVFQLLGVRR